VESFDFLVHSFYFSREKRNKFFTQIADF